MKRLMGFGTTVRAVLLGTFVMGLTACGGTGTAPTISSPYVSCVSDGSDNIWDFTALVDDAEGYEDVIEVLVEAYDLAGDPDNAAATVYLAYEGNGQWAGTVAESAEPGLVCDRILDFEFDFIAGDGGGNEAGPITFVPAY